jgi:uncharacterized protein (UPF0128 family)
MDRNKGGRVVGVIHTQRRQQGAGGSPLRAAFYPQPLRLVARPDKEMARMIENGLALFALRGHTAAIDYLLSIKVPMRTISRVLWKPQQRRVCGN